MKKIINHSIEITFSIKIIEDFKKFIEKNANFFVAIILIVISIYSFDTYFRNGLALAYNDARSHLDIGRRVVEGLKPGLAQLGSVWLPLPHFLMIPTIWIDFFWHSGLSGAIQSMVSYVFCGVLIYSYLKKLKVGVFGRILGVSVFALNLNVFYLTSTAMTELLLLATMTATAYFLMSWHRDGKLLDLIKSAFFVMLSTLVRYDGWFLLGVDVALLAFNLISEKGYKEAEGKVILFVTLGFFGIFLWFLWNILIFGDPLYFALGPFSAHAQQAQIFEAGELFTKGNLYLSIKAYLYALFYNTYTVMAFLGAGGAYLLWRDSKINKGVRISSLALIAPLAFNILALYLGHSVLFVRGVMGDTWFNVRYGMMLMPSIAIFVGFLVDRLKNFRFVTTGLFVFVTFFAILSGDVVTIEDALIGASGKNVAEVSGWLKENVADEPGFVLISVASHDAIIFSSDLPMTKFIHEGTGDYWDAATQNPQRWASWIVMRTNDVNDMAFKDLKDTNWENYYNLVNHYPFADIYELKPEYRASVQTKPVLANNK